MTWLTRGGGVEIRKGGGIVANEFSRQPAHEKSCEIVRFGRQDGAAGRSIEQEARVKCGCLRRGGHSEAGPDSNTHRCYPFQLHSNSPDVMMHFTLRLPLNWDLA
jgi:hypothetical protein